MRATKVRIHARSLDLADPPTSFSSARTTVLCDQDFKFGQRKMQAPPETMQGLFDPWFTMGGQTEMYETPEMFRDRPSMTTNPYAPASAHVGYGGNPFFPRGNFPKAIAIQAPKRGNNPTTLDVFNHAVASDNKNDVFAQQKISKEDKSQDVTKSD